jgi:hypothetical protein
LILNRVVFSLGVWDSLGMRLSVCDPVLCVCYRPAIFMSEVQQLRTKYTANLSIGGLGQLKHLGERRCVSNVGATGLQRVQAMISALSRVSQSRLIDGRATDITLQRWLGGCRAGSILHQKDTEKFPGNIGGC